MQTDAQLLRAAISKAVDIVTALGSLAPALEDVDLGVLARLLFDNAQVGLTPDELKAWRCAGSSRIAREFMLEVERREADGRIVFQPMLASQLGVPRRVRPMLPTDVDGSRHFYADAYHDRRLPPRAKVLVMEMCVKAEKERAPLPYAVDEIATEFGWSRRRVLADARAAQRAGYIDILPREMLLLRDPRDRPK